MDYFVILTLSSLSPPPLSTSALSTTKHIVNRIGDIFNKENSRITTTLPRDPPLRSRRQPHFGSCDTFYLAHTYNKRNVNAKLIKSFKIHLNKSFPKKQRVHIHFSSIKIELAQIRKSNCLGSKHRQPSL